MHHAAHVLFWCCHVDGHTDQKQEVKISKTKLWLASITLFVHLFAVVARPRRQNAQFHVFWRTLTQDNDFSNSFFKLRYSPLEFNCRKICQHLTNWTPWNKSDKFWNSMNSLLKRHFRHRRRRHCLKFLFSSPEPVVSCSRGLISFRKWRKKSPF